MTTKSIEEITAETVLKLTEIGSYIVTEEILCQYAANIRADEAEKMNAAIGEIELAQHVATRDAVTSEAKTAFAIYRDPHFSNVWNSIENAIKNMEKPEL